MKQKLLFLFTAFLFSFSSMAQTVIVQHPIDQTICENETVTLNVMATGSSLSYQWYYDNQALPNEVASSITIANATSANSGNYYCIVSSPAYPDAYSAVAALTVYQAPMIMMQPVSQNLCSGEDIILSIQASGDSLSYQWYVDSEPISDANSNVLTIPNATHLNTGFYVCVVSSPSCPPMQSVQAVVDVAMPIEITSQPLSYTVCQGATVELSVTATGEDLTYQWYWNGNPTNNTLDHISIATSALVDASTALTCLVSSPTCPSVLSEEAFLIVMGNSMNLPDVSACDSYALPPLQIPGAGYFSGPSGTGVEFFPGDLVTVTTTLYVYVSDGMCPSDSDFVITIGGPFNAVMEPQGYTMICPDSPAMALSIVGPQGEMTYAWSSTGSPFETGSDPSYIIINQPGVYTCTIMNECGQTLTLSRTVTLANGTINQPDTLVACGDANGTAVFDLNQLVMQITNEPLNYEIYFYSDYEDASYNTINDFESLNGSLLYPSTQDQIIFARVDDVYSGAGCSWVFPIALIVEDCEATSNTISGIVRIDSNNNGCTSDDLPAVGITVIKTFNNTVNYTYTDAQGYYAFNNVQEGEHYVALYGSSLPPGGYIAGPTENNGSYLFNIVGTEVSTTADFCIGTPLPVTDASVYFYANTVARPGFPAFYSMTVVNTGTLPLSGNASLVYDASKLDFSMADPAITSQTNNILYFYVDTILPSQARTFTIYFTVKVPPIVNADDELHFIADMQTVATDVNPDDNVAAITQIVVNSFDPNDIAVQQGPEILQNQVDDYLNYTIRFQNTGTADAINVRVENELDTLLDWSTFRPVASSHAMTTDRVDNNVVFRFNEIHLPASSVDEVGSNGFITYKIKPKQTMQLGDVISNVADIYFDFNLPIVTNTVTTELVNALGVTENGFADLKMYPNPASDKITLQFGETLENVAIAVYDLQGKMIVNTNVSLQGGATVFDVSKIQPGMYFVKIVSGNQSAVRKLIVN